MTTLKYMINNIALGKTIYILHPKEYQIQPLFYSKMGIEPNISNTLYITDIPQRTAGQVIVK